MLQEMRLVLRAHRLPGMGDDDVPSMSQVLRMATVGGAKTTAFAKPISCCSTGVRSPTPISMRRPRCSMP
jgi:5-methylthioadenosine/S-adenosylhomocysteine deaminase